MNDELALSIQGLHKSFPGVTALDDINLDIRTGEVHALLGENGAGKSTLVKIISGVYRRDQGIIRYEGTERDFASPSEAFKKGIGVIHQETSLIPQLTVIQNVFLGIEFTKSPLKYFDESKMLSAFLRLSERLDFSLSPETRAGALSVAEQKMVEIQKAMAHRMNLLIMDEPTDSLSDKEIRRLFRVISDLRRENITVLYITHNLDEVLEISDRLTVLRDGRKIDTVMTGKTTKDEIVFMMIGRGLAKVKNISRKPPSGIEAFRVENLRRGAAVNNVSFHAFPGEILGITGLIGSGKTELARLIFGADRYEGGCIFIGDKSARIRSPRDAVRNNIGMTPDDRKKLGLLLNHEAYKNITLSSINKYTRHGVISISKELEKTSEITSQLDIKISSPFQPVKNLSGGNQQKVVIGKWLALGPRILIMDEPTRGIDINAKAEIFGIIRELARNGTCVIYISSEVTEVAQIADRTLVMKKGAIAAEYGPGVPPETIMQFILKGNE